MNKLQFVKHRVFDHCGEIPNEMWSVVPEDEPQKKKVKKDNKGVLPPLVVREIPADVQERIESMATKKPQAKRKRGETIEPEQVQPQPEQSTPKKKKNKTVRKQTTKKPKKIQPYKMRVLMTKRPNLMLLIIPKPNQIKPNL